MLLFKIQNNEFCFAIQASCRRENTNVSVTCIILHFTAQSTVRFLPGAVSRALWHYHETTSLSYIFIYLPDILQLKLSHLIKWFLCSSIFWNYKLRAWQFNNRWFSLSFLCLSCRKVLDNIVFVVLFSAICKQNKLYVI